jgi:hypothetical protein
MYKMEGTYINIKKTKGLNNINFSGGGQIINLPMAPIYLGPALWLPDSFDIHYIIPSTVGNLQTVCLVNLLEVQTLSQHTLFVLAIHDVLTNRPHSTQLGIILRSILKGKLRETGIDQSP